MALSLIVTAVTRAVVAAIDSTLLKFTLLRPVWRSIEILTDESPFSLIGTWQLISLFETDTLIFFSETTQTPDKLFGVKVFNVLNMIFAFKD